LPLIDPVEKTPAVGGVRRSLPPTAWQEVQSIPLVDPPWLPMDAWLILLCVTDRVVPVVVAFAAIETVKVVALGMVLIVTVSWVVFTAVRVTPVFVAVAAALKVKLVALVTDVATVSLAGMPGPEIAVPDDNDTGVAVVTVVLPAVVFAVNVVVVDVELGMPVPATVIPTVRALVEAVVTVVLPLVVLAVIVDDNPVPLIQGLLELWQCTQKVGLVEALYTLVPRLGCAAGATPLMVTLDVSPSWLKSMIVEKLVPT